MPPHTFNSSYETLSTELPDKSEDLTLNLQQLDHSANNDMPNSTSLYESVNYDAVDLANGMHNHHQAKQPRAIKEKQDFTDESGIYQNDQPTRKENGCAVPQVFENLPQYQANVSKPHLDENGYVMDDTPVAVELDENSYVLDNCTETNVATANVYSSI